MNSSTIQRTNDVHTGETSGKEEHIYPNLIAEIPGVELETDFEEIKDKVQVTLAHLLADQSAAAARNANISKTTRVDSNTTGVHRSNIILDIKYDSDDDSDGVTVCHQKWKRTIIVMTATMTLIMTLYQCPKHSQGYVNWMVVVRKYH